MIISTKTEQKYLEMAQAAFDAGDEDSAKEYLARAEEIEEIVNNWESFCYIENSRAEQDYLDSLE